MSKEFLFSIVFSLFFVGCAIGPDYLTPQLPVGDAFHNRSENSATKREILWWKSFEDEQLQMLIERGTVANLDVRQALARINQSRALARAAFTELLPGALLKSSYQKAEDVGARFPGGSGFRYQVYSGSIDAAWEIDIFGRLRRELEARNAEYDSQVADLRDVICMTASEIATAYLELRAAQAQLAISEKNRDLQSDSLKLVHTKFEFGQVSELDVAQAKTQLAQTESTLPTLEVAVKTHMHRLAVLTGEMPTSLYADFAKGEEIPDFNGPLSIGSPEELLQQRPDIRAVERMLAAKTARIGVAWGELFPKITVNGALGVEAPIFSNLDRDHSFYRVGPSISWAAFDSGRLRSRVTLAEQETQEALLAYQSTVLRSLEEVENALASFGAQARRTAQLKLAEKASRRAYTIADDQYREGTLDFISVLSTQQTLLQSESDVVEGRKQLALAIVNIYKALGGGWEAWELTEDRELVAPSVGTDPRS